MIDPGKLVLSHRIFAVTTLTIREKSRTVGFFYNKEDAVGSVLTNACDIHEDIYVYVVIEEVTEGIHYQVESEKWFVWEDGYSPCSKPKHLKNVCNWSMG